MAAQASKQEWNRILLLKLTDSLDAFLDKKALGKDGSCRQGHTTPRSDLDGDQISLEFRPDLHNWYINGSHRLDRTNQSNSRCE